MSKCVIEWCPNIQYHPYEQCLLHAERKYTKKRMLQNINQLVDSAFEVALKNIKATKQFRIEHLPISPQSSLRGFADGLDDQG